MQTAKKIATIICESTTEPAKPIILNKVRQGEMVRVRANLQDVGLKNRNKRIYEEKDLLRGLDAPHIKELIKNKSWVGEAGHPMNADLKRQMGIDNRNISHRINSWSFDKPVISGEIEALDGGEGSVGRLFHNLILQDLKTAYSLRAIGSVSTTAQGNVVKGNIHVVCYDWVFVPSHKIAYQKDIINKINESTNNNMLAESYTKDIVLSEMVEYAKTSKNFKYVSEFLELEITGVSLSEDCSKVIVNDTDNNRILVNLNEKVQAELGNKKVLSSYMNKFF